MFEVRCADDSDIVPKMLSPVASIVSHRFAYICPSQIFLAHCSMNAFNIPLLVLLSRLGPQYHRAINILGLGVLLEVITRLKRRNVAAKNGSVEK